MIKMTYKIWLLAIGFQTVFYQLFDSELADYLPVIVIVEIIGSLPGLILLYITIKILINRINNSSYYKRTVIIASALSGFITSYLTMCVIADILLSYSTALIIPSISMLAALLSAFTFSETINNNFHDYKNSKNA